MTPLPPAFRRRLVAILVLCSFIAAACGSAVAQTTTERAVAVDQTTTEQAVAIDAPPPATGHQFGTSIAEYGNSDNDTQRASSDATTIEWNDLIPAGSTPAEVFARFEERFDDVEVGSPESVALYDEMQAEFNPEAVNPNLDGQKIWLAGFVAPLTYEDDIVTEFLLVPTFGACIHVPPPPPNQTILVSVDKADGLTVEDSWGAVWVEGTLTLENASTDLAEASYTITTATSGVYNNF